MPSPKKRTPRISVPSVTPVAAKMMPVARCEILRRVDAPDVGDAHRAAALLVLRLVDDQPREDLPVQAAHRGRGQHPSGAPPVPITACTPLPTTAAAMPADRSPSEMSRMRAPVARISVDQPLVARPVEHDDDEVVDARARGTGRCAFRFSATGASRLTASLALGPTTSFSM